MVATARSAAAAQINPLYSLCGANVYAHTSLRPKTGHLDQFSPFAGLWPAVVTNTPIH